MAHNLNQINGKTAFASANGKKAWHNLGQVVEGSMTAQEAIELAMLDYEVGIQPASFGIGNEQNIVVPDKFVTYRKDINMPLGIVGGRYNVIQNKEAFSFFDSIIGSDMAMYETAGAIGNGERIFITAKMPNFIRISGTDDITEIFVLLTSSHDGSGSIVGAVVPQRVVCENTLNAALKNCISKVSIRHTSNALIKLEEAHKLLGITHAYTEELNLCFNQLAKEKITDSEVKFLIEQLFTSEKIDSTRIKNIREAVLESYHTGIGQENIVGTKWGFYNGLTYHLDHINKYKNEDVKFDSILNGNSANIANKAFNILLGMQ